MSDFKRLNHNDLDRLSSDELVAYIREAHRLGHRAALEDGFAVLVFRHEGDVKRRVRAKVPSADVEDVAQEALFSAIKNIVEDSEIRNFRGLLNRIVSRRIADYTDKRAKSIRARPLAEENEDDETIWGDVPSEEDESAAVAVRDLIAEVYSALNPVHQRVVDLYVFGGTSAQETADEVNERFKGHADLGTEMSVDNVHQIAKRFRDDLRGLLEDAED